MDITCKNIKPDYSMYFYNSNNSEVGHLDFNGSFMSFEGDFERSAVIFFDMVAELFSSRLKEERRRGILIAAEQCFGSEHGNELARRLKANAESLSDQSI